MRNLYALDPCVQRDLGPAVVAMFGDVGDEHCGAFLVRQLTMRGRQVFRVIASCGSGWEHISVSLPNRCPTWQEMAWMADLFFEPHETLVQFRPPASEYVNMHKFCLHWWKPIGAELLRPPMELVG